MTANNIKYSNHDIIGIASNLFWNSKHHYRPQRSWAKVIFSQACVCPQWGLPQCMLGYTPPKSKSRPPMEADPPREQTHPPEADTPRSRHPPKEQTTPGSSRFQHTVYERPVRILLECILVLE